MSRPRLLLIANPNASRCREGLGPAVSALAMAGFDINLRCPASSEAIAGVIASEGGEAEAVVVAGGDGTVNAAADALIACGRPVGLLPLGTANDLALTLGIPQDPVAAAAVIADGAPRAIDVGRANGHAFVNVASIGLSVKIAERQDPVRKQQWRTLSYLITTLRVLGEADRFAARITCDGQSVDVEAYQIAVGNGVHYGGGLTVAENAAIDDGLLDVYAIEAGSLAEVVGLAPALLIGTQGRSTAVTTLRGRHVVIETERPMPVNTDGEVTTETPVEMNVERGALRVYAPPVEMPEPTS
ncbi:lipid kinase [Tepidamorphus gemmatus]|nr:lipid kinase [Tepidamorphus gemmatus]